MCKYTRGSIKTASDMKAESTLCLGSLALLYRSTCASNPWIFFDVATARVSIFPLGSGAVSWDGWFTMFTNLGRMLWEEPKYLNHSQALQLLQLTSTRPVIFNDQNLQTICGCNMHFLTIGESYLSYFCQQDGGCPPRFSPQRLMIQIRYSLMFRSPVQDEEVLIDEGIGSPVGLRVAMLRC